MEMIKQKKLSYSKEEKIMNYKNKKEFRQILKNSSLNDIDKKNIEFIIEYFQDKHDPKLASRSFLFHGDAGIGKTFLAEKLLQVLEVEILYMACADFSFRYANKCSSFDEIIKKANNSKKQVLFFDDLNYLLEHDDGEVVSIDQRSLMRLLDLVKRNPDKLMIATMNDYSCLDERMIDRIEVKIHFELPSNENKKAFLKKTFKEHLQNKQIKYITDNSIGYNYRDIPEMVKLAYRLGINNINMDSLKDAIKIYRPTQLYGYAIQNGIDVGLKDIIGKDNAKKIVERIVHIYKNDRLSKQLGLKRSNLLLFHGLPGTGKSFMATALAGEIGFPLIRIRAKDIYEAGPFFAVETITDMAKRYRNCIIFIDEAEKLIGNGRFGEDNPALGEFHRCLDGADGDEIQSILILAVNDLSRFGGTLMDRFVNVSFDMPSFDERLTFFKQKIERTKHHVKLDLPCDRLARITENMSYRDMDRYWNDIMFYYLEHRTEKPDNIIDRVNQRFYDRNLQQAMYS